MRKQFFLLAPLFCALIGSTYGQPGNALFNTPAVHKIEMYFSQANYWDSLTYYYDQKQLTGNSTYLQSDSVVINGELLPSVGVRFKGNSSYNWAKNFPSVKLPFKLDFNKYVSSQKFDGLKKLNLKNEVKDPTMLRSKLITDFLLKQGIITPRIGYTELYINDVYWGLYTVVEDIDKTFLENWMIDENGNLYKAFPRYTNSEGQGGTNLSWIGTNQNNYYNRFKLQTNKTQNDWSKLIELHDVINNTPTNQFQTDLESILNSESFLKAWGAMTLLFNYDSYPYFGNNFYLYFKPNTNRFFWIPCDYDLGIGAWHPNLTISQSEELGIFYMPSNGPRPLASRMLENTYYRNAYVDVVCEYVQTDFDTAWFRPRMDSIADAIRPFLYADPNKFYENAQFEANMYNTVQNFPGIIPFIANRKTAVENQLLDIGCTPLVVKESLGHQNVNLYPNPFAENATMKLPANITEVQVFSVSGKNAKVYFPSNQQVELKSTDLGSGLFFYKTFDGNIPVRSGKFIVSQ